MAVLIPRTVLICAIPSLVVLLTLVWLKKRKQKEDTRTSSSEDSVPSTSSSSSEVRTETCGGGTGDGHGVGGGDRVPGWEEEEKKDRQNLIGTEIVFPTAEVVPPFPSCCDGEDLRRGPRGISREERSEEEELLLLSAVAPKETTKEVGGGDTLPEELQDINSGNQGAAVDRVVNEDTELARVETIEEEYVPDVVDIENHTLIEEDCTEGQKTSEISVKDTLEISLEEVSSERNFAEVESVVPVQEVIQEVSHCLNEDCQDFDNQNTEVGGVESEVLLQEDKPAASPEIVAGVIDSEELRLSPIGSLECSYTTVHKEDDNPDTVTVPEDCEEVDRDNCVVEIKREPVEVTLVKDEITVVELPESDIKKVESVPDGEQIKEEEEQNSVQEDHLEAVDCPEGVEVTENIVEIVSDLPPKSPCGSCPIKEEIPSFEEVLEEKYLIEKELCKVELDAEAEVEESPIVAVTCLQSVKTEVEDHRVVEVVAVDTRTVSVKGETPQDCVQESSSTSEDLPGVCESTNEGTVAADKVKDIDLIEETTTTDGGTMRQKDTACEMAQCTTAVEKGTKEVLELQEAVERLQVGSETPEPDQNPEPVPGHHRPRKGKGESDSHKMSNGGTNTSAYGSASHSPTEEMLESSTVSNYSDLHSEGSSDSGNGGSEIHLPLLLEATAVASNLHQGSMAQEAPPREVAAVPLLQFYEFELPQSLCGRLIGQGGRFVKLIKAKTHANISIKNHPISEYVKLCTVIGTSEDITAALAMIRKKFPENRYPDVTLLPVSLPICGSFAVPETLQLQLPEGIVCDVVLSSMVNAGHFFLQQPTHPTYPSLSRLDQFMLACYMNAGTAPEVPRPIEAGFICAAPMMGGWYRSQVVNVYADTDECDVKFVDYGGFARVANSSLHQIRVSTVIEFLEKSWNFKRGRHPEFCLNTGKSLKIVITDWSDFMTLPFQASECYLANVAPVDDAEGWPLEACAAFEELAQGQILQSQIVSYSSEGIPCVHLFRIQGAATTFINRELVNNGLAVWVDNEE